MNAPIARNLQADAGALHAAARDTKDRIRNAVNLYEKQAILAEEIGLGESDLSRLLNGSLLNFCKLIGALGFSVYREDYVRSLEKLLKEKL